MRHSPNQRLIATDVLIEFEDGSVCFGIPRGATLGDISESLGEIGKWHKGRPLAIGVRFKAPQESGSIHVPANAPISSPVSQPGRAPRSRTDNPAARPLRRVKGAELGEDELHHNSIQGDG